MPAAGAGCATASATSDDPEAMLETAAADSCSARRRLIELSLSMKYLPAAIVAVYPRRPRGARPFAVGRGLLHEGVAYLTTPLLRSFWMSSAPYPAAASTSSLC